MIDEGITYGNFIWSNPLQPMFLAYACGGDTIPMFSASRPLSPGIAPLRTIFRLAPSPPSPQTPLPRGTWHPPTATTSRIPPTQAQCTSVITTVPLASCLTTYFYMSAYLSRPDHSTCLALLRATDVAGSAAVGKLLGCLLGRLAGRSSLLVGGSVETDHQRARE